MKLAIVGTRTFEDWEAFSDAVNMGVASEWAGQDITQIISGGARGTRGTDAMAKRYAELEFGIEYIEFPADWKAHRRAAGPIRNKQIAKACDEMLAFWDGESRGTLDAIKQTVAAGKRVTIIPIPRNG